MVQELGYDSCAMFPGRQSTFNMNLGAYGYSQQPYGQDHYGQFNIDTGCLPPQQSTCAWAGVYPTTPTGASAANGRPPSGGGMDDWNYGPANNSQVGPSSGGSQQGTPPGSLSYYRSTGNITTDYMQQGSMPSPPMMPGSPTSSSGQMQYGANPQNSQRQSSRAPYDWMKKQSYPTTPASGKTRTKDKYRVVYTDHQRLELEKEFHYSRYITIRRKAELAQTLNLSERQVKIWFQNRRAKERKQNKKREDSMQSGSGAVNVKTELSPGTSGSSVTSPTPNLTSPGMAHPLGPSPYQTVHTPLSQQSHIPIHSQAMSQLSHSDVQQPITSLHMAAHMTSQPIHIMPSAHS